MHCGNGSPFISYTSLELFDNPYLVPLLLSAHGDILVETIYTFSINDYFSLFLPKLNIV